MRIYICDKQNVDIDAAYEHIKASSESEMKERIMRFCMEDDRKTALVREVLFNGILHEKYGTGRVSVLKNGYGKPYVEQDAGFFFNISHSGDLVGIVFGDSSAGLDIEKNDKAAGFKDLLCLFDDMDKEYILNSDDPEMTFLRVWTCREALSKKEGTGLTLYEKENVSFAYDDGRAYLRGVEHRFYGYDYPDHLITLCMEPGQEKPGIMMADEEMWESMVRMFYTDYSL